jgi:hypothetical protein
VIILVFVRLALLHQLRLLIACLLLAVAARPVATALESPRAVAALVASAGVRSGVVVGPRVAVRSPSRAAPVRAAARRSTPADLAAPALTALEQVAHRGASPLYLTQLRFLL